MNRQPRMRRIVVEAIIRAPVEIVWKRSQDPEFHTAWDIRFNRISYLDATDERGFHLMEYRTNIAFGIKVKGYGRYLGNAEHSHSSFEFDSDDWKSIIRNGRGIWLYRSCPEGTLLKTVYDYDVRHGLLGAVLDRLVFRGLLQLATEWGFETLRRWCAGDDTATQRRRSRLKFAIFYLGRRFGMRPRAAEARSWLGSGQVNETVYEKAVMAADAVAGRAT